MAKLTLVNIILRWTCTCDFYRNMYILLLLGEIIFVYKLNQSTFENRRNKILKLTFNILLFSFYNFNQNFSIFYTPKLLKHLSRWILLANSLIMIFLKFRENSIVLVGRKLLLLFFLFSLLYKGEYIIYFKSMNSFGTFLFNAQLYNMEKDFCKYMYVFVVDTMKILHSPGNT